jgi:ABC-type nitrate/sulfonate/bicarbonate transport system permease component
MSAGYFIGVALGVGIGLLIGYVRFLYKLAWHYGYTQQRS